MSHLDLSRTLLDLAGIADPDFPGRSLAGELLACGGPEPLPVLAEGVRYAAERFSRREGERKEIVEPVPSEEMPQPEEVEEGATDYQDELAQLLPPRDSES